MRPEKSVPPVRMKTATRAAILLGLLLAAASLYVWQRYQGFLEQPLAIAPGGAVFNVDSGMSGRAVITRLAGLGLSQNGWQWRMLLRLRPTVFRAGEYRLEPGLLPQGLLRKLQAGEVIRYRFTIVEGWSYRQLLGALQADAVLGPRVKADLEKGVWQELVKKWHPPEGAFLPETYVFTRSDSAVDVLDRAASAMKAALAEAWDERADDHPARTPYELLILASIIEKETAVAEERAQISGVFVRRLKSGMRLQTDPSVIYGLGEAFDGDVRRRDLLTDTPYNTYTRHGLPPTPIAMPGKASLLAAAQPAGGNALYFVADGKGGHTFSDSLDQHQRAVNKLMGKN
jgi:UPF0755 protein